jgi:general secretion pathway protein A
MILLERAVQRPTLLVDDAHELTPPELRALIRRGLCKTGDSRLHNIVLFAQPSLRKSLADLQGCLLPNGVIDRIDIPPLTEEQTIAYLTHRVAQAGILPGLPFGPSELHTIHTLSEGLPERINQQSLELFEAMAMDQKRCGNLRHFFNLQDYLGKIKKWRHRPVFAGP